ncbi:hypothetical protein PBY51_014334 [Eleginops maclovinus]|uniref:Cytochrome P450 n=1 Tax=Eleginops maclovinus TaxID=56733 RepID=A0AAN8ABM8_ELEMC|nr:hypothetical protein PBY51_014334 [Eleginops maclovinus]
MFVYLILPWICIFFFILFLKFRRPKNFPPGPTPLPILGNLLNLSAHDPMRDLERLSKSYGNVYSLFLGPKPVVVINGVQALKEAMLTKGDDFAGRPQDIYATHLTANGLVLADYGPTWKEQPSLHIGNTGKSDGSTMNPKFLFPNVASNIISLIVFGERYDCEDRFFKEVLRCFRENSKLTNGPWAILYDSTPIIRNLPLPFMKGFKNMETLKKLVTGVITEHRETIVPGQPRDILDSYLDELDKSDSKDSSFNEDRLVMFILDLLFAGTDTSANTMLSGFLYLTTFPQIQEQCQQEIDQVLGNKDHASYDDRHNMPYTLALIHEMQRKANTVPFSVYHVATKDTQLMGYSLPKGTIVIPNMKSVLNEEGQWKFPHEFNPENFLNDEGEFVKPEAFMPFCAGPRMCPGERLAQMKLFLITVTLLRKFKFIWPEDAGEPDYSPVMGVTLSPQPYRMKIQLRTTQ